MELFDTHAHYNDEKFDEDRDMLLQEIYKSGVTKLVNAGYSLKSSKEAVEIAKKYSWMYAICGISPNDIPDSEEKIENEIEELKKFILFENSVENVENTTQNTSITVDNTVENAESVADKTILSIEKNRNKIVAIGEIGLDYYWNKENKELQKYAFTKQIELANGLNLPIVIHTREAVDDTIDVLKNQVQAIKKGIFHCCLMNRELVKQALELGFYISFAGPITFKNAKNANEIIDIVPMNKILIETDSPYLAPEPFRGTRNDSRNVRFMAEKIASVKNMPVEEVASITYQNAVRIFEI